MKSNPDILRELSTEYAIISETLEGEDNSKMMDVAHALNAGADSIESNDRVRDALKKIEDFSRNAAAQGDITGNAASHAFDKAHELITEEMGEF